MDRSLSLLPDSSQKEQIFALLRSHHPPPPHLVSKSTVAAISEEVEVKAREILHLREALERAEAEYVTLKEHCTNLRSLLAPIRRLPSEILVQIFLFYEIVRLEVQAEETWDSVADEDRFSERELAELGRKGLLVLSRVCVRWHDIVLGTPKFWETFKINSSELWLKTKHGAKGIRLLKSALARGGDAPLDISICILNFRRSAPDHSPVLKLLGEHSHRWKKAFFFCRSVEFDHLQNIKGKLPLLEKLELETHDEFDAQVASNLVELFADAPRLHTLYLGGLHSLDPLAEMHLSALRTFRFLAQDPLDVSEAVALMPKLPEALEFWLQLLLCNWDPEDDDDIASLEITPTSSDISTFTIHIRDMFSPAICIKALNELLHGLTLPRLRFLRFRSDSAPHDVLSWPHSAFLDFATRSSFPARLQTFIISDVAITEADLVQTLAVLPLLQHLAISDFDLIQSQRRQDGIDHLLLTDSLLTALTIRSDPDSQLVPLLRTFVCTSRLQFTDDVFADFLDSRCVVGDHPFSVQMSWIQTRFRQLEPQLAARIRELGIQKRLSWEFLRAPRWSNTES
ncbi:hypothetical protein R3P38DRAFT_2879357 [Favolaschia claudopus]|uniref:F-box domain-containing protein n=1 Tax=Favolaschia claudopus TaxID=2862362 RepID=A0AAW0D158_9AGAR